MFLNDRKQTSGIKVVGRTFVDLEKNEAQELV